MKFRINNKYFRWGLTAFLVVSAGIIFYYFMFHGSNIHSGVSTVINILMPVVVGMAIAYLLTPVLNFIETKIMLPLCRKCKIRESGKRNSIIRGAGILVTAFLFVALIYMIFSMLISQIVPSVQNLISNFDNYTTNFTVWLNRTLEDNTELKDYVLKTVDKYSGELEKLVTDILPNTMELIKTVSLSVIGVLHFVWDFVIGFIISIYILGSKEVFAGQAKKIVYAFFDAPSANQIVSNVRFIHSTFSGFISGKIVDSIIIGIICFACTSIIGTPYAILVSVIIGVTNIIPFFGPWLGAIPSALLILMVNPLQCLYFVILILFIQQFDGNILGPKILGDSTGLSGFWVIFSITIFGGLFGVLGMVVGVPIFAVLYAGFRALVNRQLAKKKLPTDTQPYLMVGSITEENTFVEYMPVKKKKKVSNDKAKTLQQTLKEKMAGKKEE